MNTVCEVCGNVGYKTLLVCCRECKCSAAYLYCLDKIFFDVSLADWLCYECLQRRGELSILRKNAMDTFLPHSSNDGCQKVFSCTGFINNTNARERSVDSIDISSSSRHDTTESSESSVIFIECRKGSIHHRVKTKKMDAASSSSKSSEEEITSANDSSESDDLHAPLRADYVLSYRSYLSEAQKKRVVSFIQEIQPEVIVFAIVMQKRNVQPLGISMEYAFAHFPHKSTNVTLETSDESMKWHPKFYKRNASRKNMLMGQWLDFVRGNHVQEGDICLLFLTEGGRRSTFTVYLLCPTATHSIESEDSGVVPQPPYIVPCRNPLSKSQKKIVEERVRAIQSEVPICVAVMKNNIVGDAQKWMLCMGKAWETQMVIHNGRRWFLNGGWAKFARDNGLRVGDICLFELKKNEMKVHIISRERFSLK
ncbi:hypothetical protein BS78_01G151900 [Paspalum vaginatum]|nr:hypothetical protein BS78_01G151900 [Paspalum vaginatum]